MKLKFLLLSLLIVFTLFSCNRDNDGDGLPVYSITIMSPSAEELVSGENINIHVNFDEASDLTIHHVNVQITTDNGEVIYNMPSVAHIHEDSGHHEHLDDFTPNVPSGTELTLTAKVWGHSDGIAEQSISEDYIVK